MDYQTFIDNLSPDIVARLRQGVETGRWPDGQLLTPAQREHSLQAVIAWEQKNLPEEQRVGYIDKGKKGAADDAIEEASQMRWVDDTGEGSQ
jgi:uncharacterized protein YeaC (DUF1315 family)